MAKIRDLQKSGKTVNSEVGSVISFRSKLENWAEGMDYCAISVPQAVTKKLGTKAAVLVMAQINQSDWFKVSLFPVGGGRHFIRVRKKVRIAWNLKRGDRVAVRIRVLDRDADAVIPKDLEKALRRNAALKEFKSISPGARNFLLRKIVDAVKAETRAKRIEETVEAARKRSKNR